MERTGRLVVRIHPREQVGSEVGGHEDDRSQMPRHLKVGTSNNSITESSRVAPRTSVARSTNVPHDPLHDGDSVIDRFGDELRAAGRTTGTIRVRQSQLRRFERCIGRDIDQATRDDVVSYLAEPMKPETRASKRHALLGYYACAMREGLVSKNPLQDLPRSKRQRHLPRPMPDEAFRVALATAPSRVRSMLILARYAGLRAGEIAAVHHDDLVGSTLYVVGKGEKPAAVPAHPLVQDVVSSADGFVFPSSSNETGHLRSMTVTKLASEHLRTVAGPGWTLHTLRHAFGTSVYRTSGHDLRMAQQLLRHASPATTAIYTLVEDDRAASVVANLAV
jgi:site-specific recombinase XerD